MKKKKSHSAAFKYEVSVVAIKGELTQSQISSKYEIHSSQITNWKKQALEAIKQLFSGKLPPGKQDLLDEKEKSKPYEEIGRLKVELDWMKKNLILSCKDKKMLIEPNNPDISIVRQCQLLGLNRSVYYYQYKGIDEHTENLMRLIDERYTARPDEGSRKIMVYLNNLGYDVTRNQVKYLMDKMGLQAIYPKPNTSAKSRQEHKIYAYLLNDICVYYRNEVWCSDITYIRMKHGHIYLVAIMDWYSRYVIDWQLSISLEAEFCIDTLRRALDNSICGIFNTDQGAQYTSNAWINTLLNRDISISMDAKGRCFDNIFIERLWRSVKYECIYLKEFESVAEVREALTDYFEYYNTDRYHQSLGYKTPADVYFGKVKIENVFDNLTSIF